MFQFNVYIYIIHYKMYLQFEDDPKGKYHKIQQEEELCIILLQHAIPEGDPIKVA